MACPARAQTQLGGWGVESFLAFGAAAFALEFGYDRDWLKKIPASGLPEAE